MDKNLAVYMNMCASTEDYLDANTDLVDKVLRLKTEKSEFSINRTELDVQVRMQTEVITGITADKKVSFSSYGEMIISLAKKGLVWARDTNNQALVAVFTITPTGYANQTYANKLDQGLAVYNALNGNAAVLVGYSLKDTELAAMADMGKTCASAMIAPSKAKASKKTAKGTVGVIQQKLDANLTTMDDMITSEYSKTEKKFVLGYQNSRKMETVGVRHTGLSAVITNAATGKAIENAMFTIIGTSKTATTNMAGLAEIIKMKSGSFHISISADGYTTLLQDVTVPKGKTLELAIALVLA